VRWAMPCPNRPSVAAALREFAAGGRTRVHGADRRQGGAVRDGHRAEEKSGRGTGAPPEAHIAFAASGPDIGVKGCPRRRDTGTGCPRRRDTGTGCPRRRDTGTGCPRRRDTGTGCRMVGNARIKSASRREAARTLCFVLPPAAHNSRAMVCAAARLASHGGRVTQAEFRLGLVMEVLTAVLESRPEPEPPPPAAPQAFGLTASPRPGRRGLARPSP